MRTWFLQWNYLYQRLERQLAHFSLGTHVGTRKIRELPIYPLDYYSTDTAQQDLKAQIVERNRRWTRTVSQKPSCWKHEGLAIRGSDMVKIKVSHDVRSPKSYFMVNHVSSTTAELSCKKNRVYMPMIFSQTPKLCPRRTSEIGIVDQIIFVVTSWPLTESSLMIRSCSAHRQSGALIFKSKHRCSYLSRISSLSTGTKSALDHLVLDQNKKELICAVAKNHSKDSPSQTRDIIEGKGSVSLSCSSYSTFLTSVRAS